MKGFLGASVNRMGSWPSWLPAGGGIQNTGSEPAMKINTQRLLAFLLIVLIPLAIINILSYSQAREALTNEVLIIR